VTRRFLTTVFVLVRFAVASATPAADWSASVNNNGGGFVAVEEKR